jgi:hypothetical protein
MKREVENVARDMREDERLKQSKFKTTNLPL